MSFSYASALRFGWQTFWKNFLLFVSIFLVLLGLMLASQLLQQMIGEDSDLARMAVMLLAWAVNIVVGMGVIKILLLLHDGKTARAADLFSQTKLFFPYLGGMILYGLIVLGGLLLFVVPGIIWAITYRYTPYLIIDKQLPVLEALKKSRAITMGKRWDLFGFHLVLLVINVLGVLAFFVGQLVTGPVTMLAQAWVYRTLLKGRGKAAH